MNPPLINLLRSRAATFGKAHEGAVVVEFALISTVLIGLFAVALDFSYMVGAKRDAERMSTLIARALSSCPYKDSPVAATWKGTDCVTKTLNYVNQGLPNVIVAFPTAVLQAAAIQRRNGAIIMCSGVATNVPPSVGNTALSVLQIDNDVGMFAVIQVTYTPFLPDILSRFGVGSSLMYSEPTTDLWGNGPSFACDASSPS